MSAQEAQEPLFAASCVRTGQAGRYLAVTGTSRLAVFSDRLEIDGLAIHYPYLLRLQMTPRLGAYSNVLEVAYAAAGGTLEERWFSFRSFVPGKARWLLDELWRQVMEAKAKFSGGAVTPIVENDPVGQTVQASFPSAQTARRCSRLADDGNRPAVAVHSSRVAFPSCCPVCVAAAVTVATLGVSSGFSRFLPGGAVADWFVPVCLEHRRLGKAIVVERWSVRSSGVYLSFSSAAYAERFLDANSAEPRRGSGPSELASQVAGGTRFVVYLYAVGLWFSWLSRFSEVQAVPPGASRRALGRRYSLLTAFLGFLSVTSIALAIRALATNFDGGIDVSSNVLAAARGEPLLPHRGDALPSNRWFWGSRSLMTPELEGTKDPEPYANLQADMARLHEMQDKATPPARSV